MKAKKYPDTYLHVVECRSGEEWINPIGDEETIDLRWQIERWSNEQFAGALTLAGALTPKLNGEYYARIMTDGRPPDSVVCWSGAGFYLKEV